MAVSVVQRVERVLNLEEKQGWRNRGVIGGLAAMSERWAVDARRQNLEETIVVAVVALMARYDAGDRDSRPKIAADLRRALANDLSGLEHLTGPVEETVAETADVDAVKPAVVDEPKRPEPVPPPEPTHVAKRRVERARKKAKGNRYSPHDLQASPDILDGVVRHAPSSWLGWASCRWPTSCGICRPAMTTLVACAPSPSWSLVSR